MSTWPNKLGSKKTCRVTKKVRFLPSIANVFWDLILSFYDWGVIFSTYQNTLVAQNGRVYTNRANREALTHTRALTKEMALTYRRAVIQKGRLSQTVVLSHRTALAQEGCHTQEGSHKK